MAESKSLASIEDVKRAGNISDRVSTETLQFYLEIASMLFSEMVGSTVYAAALSRDESQTESSIIRKFKKSEALMTVGLALPALAMMPEERGLLSVISHGAGGQIEKYSFVKEVQELAATFLNLAQQISAGFIVEEGYENVWYNVIQRMFPALDEMPTVATIKSVDEELIQYLRGEITFYPGIEG